MELEMPEILFTRQTLKGGVVTPEANGRCLY